MNPFVIDNLKSLFKDKKILLGITGSIAAFKACDLIRSLRACGAQVRVVLSEGAENFVTQTTLETLSGSPVLSRFWGSSHSEPTLLGTHHIDTARWANLILIAPATAHAIGKLANGLADDLLSTEVLAFRGPLLIAPAMNPTMYDHPAVQENISRLKARGVRVLGPIEGPTSCGEVGLGRMLEPDAIIEATALLFCRPSRNEQLLITLGPTRSALDPVRYMTNRSSGWMGASLCWAATELGYDVTAVRGPCDVQLPHTTKVISVVTALEMAQATCGLWPESDIFIGTAAVLDWDIEKPSPKKFKKDERVPELKFSTNRDILSEVGRSKKSSQFVLGFAAETENMIPNGFKKLQQKRCDALFVNDVSLKDQGFESRKNGGWWLVPPDQVTALETTSKPELAKKLILLIEKIRETQRVK